MTTLSEGRTSAGTPGTGGGKGARRRRRIAGVLAGFGVVAVVAAGCGTSTAKTATSGASAITVQMTEYAFALSRTNLSAGTYTFDAVNAGKIVHSLAISGPGLSSPASTKIVQPGKSAELTVTLQGGTYNFYCPVGNHKQLGMTLDLTVAGSAGGASATTPAPAPTTVPRTSGGGVSY